MFLSQAVCYVDRWGHGAALKGLRFFTRKAARSWSSGPAPRDARAALEAARSAARWIAEQAAGGPGGGASGPGGPSRQIILCTDLDAAACTWMSAPSPQLKVVKAAAQAIAVGAGEGDEHRGPSATWMNSGELGLDTSVQALSESGPVLGPGAVGHRQRMGVVSVADLGVRTLLDALDDLGRPPVRVISLWHALCEAWGRRAGGEGAGKPARAGLTDDQEPPTAVVIIDPEGKLCWAWSRAGHLVAAGMLRLRRSVALRDDDARSGEAPPADADGAALARRGEVSSESAQPPEVALLEVTRADVGRVISEWLAWSTQLGLAPTRVVCLGPETVTVAGLGEDLPATPGVVAVGHALGEAWNGTVVAAEVMPDPVGATMQRLLDVGEEHEGEALSELEELSSRPGRVTRRLHQWIALALLAAAGVVGALGVRLVRGAGDLLAQTEQIQSDRAAALDKIKAIVPRAPTDADPVKTMQVEANKMQAALDRVQPEPPVLVETARVIQAVASVPGVTLQRVSISNMVIGSLVQVEAADAAAWKGVVDAVRAAPHGPHYIDWLDEVRPLGGGKTGYLLKGTWKAPPKGGPAPAPGGPGGAGGAGGAGASSTAGGGR